MFLNKSLSLRILEHVDKLSWPSQQTTHNWLTWCFLHFARKLYHFSTWRLYFYSRMSLWYMCGAPGGISLLLLLFAPLIRMCVCVQITHQHEGNAGELFFKERAAGLGEQSRAHSRPIMLVGVIKMCCRWRSRGEQICTGFICWRQSLWCLTADWRWDRRQPWSFRK